MRATPFLALLLLGCPTPGPDPDPDTDTTPCTDRDDDGDGVDACDDCDDGDPAVHPGALEACDGVDTDCDGTPHPGEADDDGDGVPDCSACDAAGYWLDIRDLSDPDLLSDALTDAMSGLRCSYRDAGDTLFLRLDNEDGWVECVYTGRRTAVNGTRPDPNADMNVEHTWPQSQGAGVEPMKCDLHHLYPTDVDANQQRGNLPFGEVVRGVSWSEGGSRIGEDAHGHTVFEPRDVHKGNVARSMLYMSFQYGWSLPGEQIDLFLRWHAADPPDARETARSLDIAGFQAYANPFVVCPGVTETLWE